MPPRFCRRCGAPFPREALQCPRCGASPAAPLLASLPVDPPSEHGSPWVPAPLPPTPATLRRQRRSWIVVTVVIAIVLAILAVALVALATVSVHQSQVEAFGITNPGSVVTTKYYNFTFPHAGTFRFAWSTNGTGSVTFSILNPSATSIYSVDSSSGSGSFSVVGGGRYSFGIYDWLPATIAIRGTYSFSAPYL